MTRHLLAILSVLAPLQACATTTPPSARTSASSVDAPRIVDATAKSRIDSTLRAFVTSGRLVGASAVVWEKGQEVYFGAFGLADREAAKPKAKRSKKR